MNIKAIEAKRNFLESQLADETLPEEQRIKIEEELKSMSQDFYGTHSVAIQANVSYEPNNHTYNIEASIPGEWLHDSSTPEAEESSESFQPFPINEVIKSSDLLEMELPPIDYLIDDFLIYGLTLLAGSGKIGKTTFLCQLSLALTQGIDFLGFNIREPKQVGYIVLENTQHKIKEYIAKQGYSSDGYVNFLFPRYDGLEERYVKVETLLQDNDVVIIDTLESFHTTLNHDRTEDVKPLLQRFRNMITETDKSIIIADHCNKTIYVDSINPFGAIKGSSSKLSGVDQALVIQEKSELECIISSKGYIEPFQLAIKKLPETLSWTLIGNVDSVVLKKEQEDILLAIEELGEDAINANIADFLGKSKSTISRQLRKMLTLDIVGFEQDYEDARGRRQKRYYRLD